MVHLTTKRLKLQRYIRSIYTLLKKNSMSPPHELDPDQQRLGAQIASFRRNAGKSSRQLADEIGTSHSTIQRVERGETAVTFNILYRILAALDCLDISVRDLGSDDNITS